MTSLQIPEAFTSVIRMGGAVAVYPIRKAKRWGGVIGTVLFVGGGVLLFVYTIVNAYLRWEKFGQAVIINSLMPPLIISIVLMIIGVFVAWTAFNNWKKAAVVYRDGLAYRDRKGVQTWRWDEVESFTSQVTKHYTSGIYTGSSHIYTLLKNDGGKLVFDDAIEDVEALAGKVREKVFPLLYQINADLYNNGQQCVFGPVKISKGFGIQIKKKTYAWDQVGEVRIQKGVLSVKKKDGKWFSGASVPAASIPNLEVLLSIINQVVGVQSG
jgi:hypothetical protein